MNANRCQVIADHASNALQILRFLPLSQADGDASEALAAVERRLHGIVFVMQQEEYDRMMADSPAFRAFMLSLEG